MKEKKKKKKKYRAHTGTWPVAKRSKKERKKTKNFSWINSETKETFNGNKTRNQRKKREITHEMEKKISKNRTRKTVLQSKRKKIQVLNKINYPQTTATTEAIGQCVSTNLLGFSGLLRVTKSILFT